MPADLPPLRRAGSSSDLERVLERARSDAHEYQAQLERDPETAQVRLAGMPHALVPTHVVSRELPRVLEQLSGRQTVALVMYRLGYLIGHAHATRFIGERGAADEELAYRVLTGPFHFAWAGYGDVDLLLMEALPDDGFAILWETDNSFSAREAIRAGERRRVCHMQAGYSAGWCSVASDLPLVTIELACRAEGVHFCRFLICHEERARRRVSEARFHQVRSSYEVMPARPPGGCAPLRA